ncbi:cache domain-containing protein [Candidatus Symbiobacter mobilis]|uniref:Serine phosphatase RsbU n=1 Tax=Candidatus Symbiobacter mobilis CR TaxID=946483 RepID=U5N9C3_9BURK|nr:cache domain-containing protein [Candidatus Symbiobacter mobilis]AGX87905.1 serine phosphatase RsbU [Candidatus Symbiobacter mobilis CR]
MTDKIFCGLSVKNSIKTKYLLTGLAICLATLLLVSTVSYYVAYSITKEQINQWAKATAFQKATELDSWFRKYGQIVEGIVSDVVIENNYNVNHLRRLLINKKLRYVDINSDRILYQIGFENNVNIHSSTKMVISDSYDVRTRPWYIQSKQSNGLIYTKPFVIYSTKEIACSVVAPLKDNGKFIGSFVTPVYLSDVISIVNNSKFGENSYAFLMDQEGNIITHPNNAFLFDEKSGFKNLTNVQGVYYSELKQALLQNQSGLIEIQDYDGESRMIITNKISSTNWILGIAIPKSSYQKPLNNLLYGYGLAMLVSLLLGLSIMYKLVGGMIRPIKSLNESVKSFSAANMSARVTVDTQDEIGELGKNFNQMADTIQEYSQSLEQKVIERTRELQEKNDKIMESIDYAERLQRAILPPLPHRLGISDDKCFVIWKPRDVVGGDMYWCRGDDRFVLVAVADCTGHGVPGALMTMALSSILDGLPRSLEGLKPSALLHRINMGLKETLRQENQDSLANDGADMALCLLDKQEKTFLYAGAKLSAFVEKAGQITEYKGTRHSVGYSHGREVTFDDRQIDWIEGSVVYFTTDGLLDQNSQEGKGGMGRGGFVRLLQSLAGQSFAAQEQTVEQLIATSLKQVEQRDDITVVGFEIGNYLKGTIGL